MNEKFGTRICLSDNIEIAASVLANFELSQCLAGKILAHLRDVKFIFF